MLQAAGWPPSLPWSPSWRYFMRIADTRSEEHTSELQSRENLVCRLLLERSSRSSDLRSFPTRRSSDLEFHRIRVMSRVAFVGIASPAAVIAIISGSALVYTLDASGGWLAAKLTVVAFMAIFHAYCGHKIGRAHV